MTPVYSAQGNRVFRYDAQGPGRKPFGDCPGNVAVALGDGRLYEFIDDNGIVGQWFPLGPDGWPSGNPTRYRLFTQPRPPADLSAVAGEYGVFVSEMRGGNGATYHLNADTLRLANPNPIRDKSGTVMTLATGYPAAVARREPVVFGSGKDWLYIAFEDRSISDRDQANVCQAVAQQLAEWGIPKQVSNDRPPGSLQKPPGTYGVVRVIANDRNFLGSAAGMSAGLKAWQSRSKPDLNQEKAAWLAHNGANGTWLDWLVFGVLHEGIGHSLVGWPDLYGTIANDKDMGPPGRLMSRPFQRSGYWRDNVLLTPAELNDLRAANTTYFYW